MQRRFTRFCLYVKLYTDGIKSLNMVLCYFCYGVQRLLSNFHFNLPSSLPRPVPLLGHKTYHRNLGQQSLMREVVSTDWVVYNKGYITIDIVHNSIHVPRDLNKVKQSVLIPVCTDKTTLGYQFLFLIDGGVILISRVSAVCMDNFSDTTQYLIKIR